jgi:hypothetical protein
MDQQLREELHTLVDSADARVFLARAIRETAPEQDSKGGWWATNEIGKTLYYVIGVGPEDVEVENGIRLALGHPVESLRK